MLGLRQTAPVLLVLLIGACAAPRFQDLRTPSGEFCSDMPVYPAGKIPEREYHRLGPIQSSTEVRTEAERLESLRKAACAAGGDAVIEAVNEEVRLPNASFGTVSSGTAVTWTRRTGADTAKPIPVLELSSAAHEGPESAPPPQPTETAATPPPPPTATPTAKPTATATPSAKPTATVVPFGKKPGAK